jgi:hypothetical protein
LACLSTVPSVIDELFRVPGLLAGVVPGVPLPDGVLSERARGEARTMLSGDDATMVVTAGVEFENVSWVSAAFSAVDERARADALHEALRARVAAGLNAEVVKQSTNRLELALPAATAVLSRFRGKTEDGDDFDTVTLRLEPTTAPAATASQLGFDAAAVAQALASKKLPPGEVEKRLAARLSRPEWEKDLAWDAVLAAAKSQHAARLPEVVEAIIRAGPWHHDDWGERSARLLLGIVPRVLDYEPTPRPVVGFTEVRLNDLLGVLRGCPVPASERAALAVRVYRALEHGDDAAAADVVAKMEAPLIVNGAFDGGEALETRHFDLYARKLPDDEQRLLLPLRTSTSNAARAAVRWFAAKRGLKVAAQKVTAPGHWELASASLATFFVLVREHFPQHLDAVAAKFGDRPALYNPTVIEAVGRAAGEAVSKTVWQVGGTRFTVRGSRASAAPAPAKKAESAKKPSARKK